MVIDCLRFSLNGVSIKVTLIYKSLSLSIQIADTILCEWGSKTVWKYTVYLRKIYTHLMGSYVIFNELMFF